MVMGSRGHDVSRLSLLLAFAGLSILPMDLHAMSLAPGMFMLQDVPPGQEVKLRMINGVLFTISNTANQAQDYTLTCRRPSQAGLATWEKGYEEIPDPTWCSLDETTITVPAKGDKQVGLVINIPDLPTNYN